MTRPRERPSAASALRDVLAAGGRPSRAQEFALAHPWCRPPAGPLAARARAAIPDSAARPPAPGETLLVSAQDDGTGGLWYLAHADDVPRGVPPWGFTASAALAVAERVAFGVLDLLVTTPLAPARAWYAERLLAPENTTFIDGGSFGASLLLGVASYHLGEPVPASLAASATLDADGRLGVVDHLEEKLEVVAGDALAVRTFVIAPGQQVTPEARAAARAGGLRLRRVATAEELIRLAFGARLDAAARRAFPDLSTCVEKAEHLYDFALHARPIVAWSGIEATARRLERALARYRRDPRARRAREKARFAALIAARHGGRPLAIPWPSAAELRAIESRPVRLHHLAHVLQSRTDAGDRALPRHVRAAQRWAKPGGDASAEDLVLLGAVGRAWARHRAYRKAARVLDAVTRRWLAWQPAQAGFPLSEWLRVVGILRDGAALDALEREVFPRVAGAPRESPRQVDVDLSFLRLARGRARVQVGRPEAALEDLAPGAGARADETFWERAPLHVRAARLRWLARALDESGDRAEARRRRDELRALVERTGEERYQLLLAELDRVRSRGGSRRVLARLAADLKRVTGGEGALLLARSRRSSWPDVLAEEYPY